MTFTQQILQRQVCGGVTLASVLSCHGNYSRCVFLVSKEERRDDPRALGGGEEAKKETDRERD